ncbi:keratinolytic protein, partial [Colletotrichum plurivorum]
RLPGCSRLLVIYIANSLVWSAFTPTFSLLFGQSTIIIMAPRANRKSQPAQPTRRRTRIANSFAKWKEPRLAPDHLALLPPPGGKKYVVNNGRPMSCYQRDSAPKRRKRQQPARKKPQARSQPVKKEQVAETISSAVATALSPASIVCAPTEWSSGERFRLVDQPSGVDVPFSPDCLATSSLLRFGKANEQQEDSFHARPSIKLPIPDHIKAMLVDDWENITKNNQLVPVPHPHPVDEILNDYLAFERPSREDGSANMDILEEVVAGLREYFEKSLGRILLYRFERPQYHEIRKVWEKATENDKNKSVCDTYGPEHLCRLMVSLPELVAQTNMDQQSVSRLREELSKFTVWLGKHAKNYFVSEYETPSQEYIDKARGF